MQVPSSQNAARVWRNGLWLDRDFMHFWAGQTISQFGSTITREALPYTAILALNATPVQIGLLGVASAAPILLVGLFAGVWVDRVRRRPLMIAADLGRALLLLCVPLAYLFDQLSITLLCLVAALVGVLTVLFDVAYQSFLPVLVKREQLVEGNSKLGVSASLAEIGGPSVGGALVQLVSGPVTVLLDALSFVFSAWSLTRIRQVEPPAVHGERPDIWHDLLSGLRAVWSHPLLRPIAISSTIRSFFGWFFGAIYGLYAIETLGLSTMVVGLTVACGGVGALLGALLAGAVTRRVGFGTATLGALFVGMGATALIWLAGSFLWAAIPLLVVAQLVNDLAMSVVTINLLSLRQTITPDRLLGRVSASMHVLGEGVGTLGLLVGGVLGAMIGLRATVAVALVGGVAGTFWLAFSPVRRLRELPPQAE